MKRLGKMVALMCLAGLLAVTTVGCKEVSEWVDKTVVVTTSLKKNELFKIGNHVMTVEEAKIFLLAQKNSLTQKYTEQIWGTMAGDQTVAEYMKEDLQANLAQMLCLVQMAEDRGVSLNKTEEERIVKAAETYLYSLSEADKQYLVVTQEQVQNAFRHYYLVEKMTAELTKEVDLEVSDDEARIITIQQIFVASAEDAQAIQAKAAKGGDFAALSQRNNESSEFQMTIGRDDISGPFADAAFALGSGEVSGVVQTDAGYHVIKCINHFEVDLTLEHKEEIVTLRKREAFQEAYTAYVKELKSYYNEEAWANINFADGFASSSRNFFDIYNEYLKR